MSDAAGQSCVSSASTMVTLTNKPATVTVTSKPVVRVSPMVTTTKSTAQPAPAGMYLLYISFSYTDFTGFVLLKILENARGEIRLLEYPQISLHFVQAPHHGKVKLLNQNVMLET